MGGRRVVEWRAFAISRALFFVSYRVAFCRHECLFAGHLEFTFIPSCLPLQRQDDYLIASLVLNTKRVLLSLCTEQQGFLISFALPTQPAVSPHPGSRETVKAPKKSQLFANPISFPSPSLHHISVLTPEVIPSLQSAQMANSLCFAPACSIKSPPKIRRFAENSAVAGRVLIVKEGTCCIGNSKFRSLEAASDTNPTIKKTSLVCAECDGNGAKVCSQCEGTGVNSVDHFNGQFKAGGLCWLCRGKKEILCGNCNGAGFLGGFMSTPDD